MVCRRFAGPTLACNLVDRVHPSVFRYPHCGCGVVLKAKHSQLLTPLANSFNLRWEEDEDEDEDDERTLASVDAAGDINSAFC